MTIILLFSTDTFGQKIINDSIVSKIENERLIKKDFGARFSIDALMNYFDYDQDRFLRNIMTSNFGLFIYYKGLFIGQSVSTNRINTKSIIYYENTSIPKDDKIKLIISNYHLGYDYDFNDKYGIESYLCYSTNNFILKKYEVDNLKINGYSIGLNFVRYFHLKNFEYLSFMIGYQYRYSNYAISFDGLYDPTHILSFTFSYKSWMTKHVKIE